MTATSADPVPTTSSEPPAPGGAGADDVRLAICAQGELFGGVERQILDLCIYARRRTGSFPHLVLFHDRELARRARDLGAAPAILKGRHRYDPGLAQRLWEYLSERNVNVVHAHGYKAAVTCALVRRRPAWRVVKTEHGRLEPAAGRAIVWAKSRLNRSLDNWATRRSAAAVCYVTDDIARHYARAHRGLKRQTIHNGIDPLDRAAMKRPQDLEPDLLHLGIVGRVTAVKGIPTALRAMASSDIPPHVRLNIIGTGPLEAALATEACALGLGDRVRFLGFRENIYDYIAHLDALLMPSLHEGLPYVLLEAMSLGVPIIASRVGGLAEVLEDGRTGILLPPGEPSAWSAAILGLANDRRRANALGDAARGEQRARYTLERMGNDYRSVYAAARAGGDDSAIHGDLGKDELEAR